MRRRGARTQRARPGLQDDHPHVVFGASRERAQQFSAVAVGLQVQRDGADVGEFGDGVEVVGRVQDRLVAARDDGVQPQRPGAGEGVDGDVAALRDQRDRAGALEGAVVAPHRCPRGDRDDAVAVRSADRQAVPQRRLAQPVLRRAAVGRLGEPGGEDHGAAGADVAGLGQQVGHRGAPGVAMTTASGAAGRSARRGHAPHAVDGGRGRVDAEHRAREPVRDEVRDRLVAVRYPAGSTHPRPRSSGGPGAGSGPPRQTDW